MNFPEEEKTAVYRDSKEHIHTVNKAVHGLRVNASRENIAFLKAVDPGMMNLHVTPAIGMVLKGSIGKIGNCKKDKHA